MEKIAPTAAELEVLNILWKTEPLTVKEIHELICKTKDVGYTTTLKIMQKMTAKGLLRREPNGKSHLYFSNYEKEETRGRLLDRFVDSAFGGSASSLVMQLLGNKKTSKEELDEIKQIIEQMENKSSLK
ncbi:BlaI/MecI/CopY family transcriptional regulator [Saccharicrinis sp. GN24d3]|uniref:BlaI/MecI/CopY family transcriptional regulator n=1 Tax=Saccharicrinis sp. GN24d3 TaxID=3458416 RepID=UPI004036BF9E